MNEKLLVEIQLLRQEHQQLMHEVRSRSFVSQELQPALPVQSELDSSEDEEILGIR